MSNIDLSVVVATYNRLPELQTMLDSLLPQIEGKAVEVLIADDCSTDATWEWLQNRFQSAPNVHVFRTAQNGGPGPARTLCLGAASGHRFIPIDSDFILMDGAIDTVLAALRNESRYDLMFFPCIQYPSMNRIGNLTGRCEISYESFLLEQYGEMIPVANLRLLQAKGFQYQPWRAGGEGLLWARFLAEGPGIFLDNAIVLYRTDVEGRISTLDFHIKHAEAMASATDAMVDLLVAGQSARFRRILAQRYLAAGTYHILAGKMRAGRQRFLSAASLGSGPAILAFAASLAGRSFFTRFFRFYRTRIATAYL